jgi:hypothetical protein
MNFVGLFPMLVFFSMMCMMMRMMPRENLRAAVVLGAKR